MEILTAVRGAWEWLGAAHVEPWNAFLPRPGCPREVPHAFTMKLRRDLTAAELAMLPGVTGVRGVPRQAGADPFDVFCLVKTFMCDAALQQAPILLLPAARAGLPAAAPMSIVPRGPVNKTELLKLASLIEGPSYGLTRAAAYLRSLAHQDATMWEVPELTWLREVSRAPAAALIPGGDEHFPHLPQAPWHLKVRFHRLPWLGD